MLPSPVHLRRRAVAVSGTRGRGNDQLILRSSLLLTAIGVVVGLPLALLVGRTLTASLYGIEAFDPMSYSFAVVGVAVVALVASALPGARAASVDPLTALRSE